MKTYDCKVRLAGSVSNEVRKYGVTRPEIDILRALHGPDAVSEVKETGSVDRSKNDERDRLEGIYLGGSVETRERVATMLGPRTVEYDDNPAPVDDDVVTPAPPVNPPRQTLSLPAGKRARDVQFLSLLTDLKAELHLSSDASVGTSHLPVQRRALRRAYQTLHRQWRWPHLHRDFDPVALSAGQRFYDMPAALDTDRVTEAVVFYNNVPSHIARGISVSDRSSYPLTTRSDPALKWDVKRPNDAAASIEVWPIPNSGTGSLVFSGYTKARDLVNDADLVDLDSDLVVMFAAASLLPADKGEKSAKLKEAQAHFMQLKADSTGPTDSVRYGMGGPSTRPWHPIIRVA